MQQAPKSSSDIPFALLRSLPFVGLLLFFWHLFPMSHYGLFFDPDGYMRLLRVDRLIETKDWYETTFNRSNAPFGESSHWSRPLDLLLIAGAGAGTLVTSFSRALEIWGWLFSLALLPGAAVLLLWAYRPYFEKIESASSHWRDLLLMTTLSSLDFLLPFYPGRPDHHGLLSLTALGQIGFALRLLGPGPKRRDAYGLGTIAALGLWISVENLLVTALALFFLMLSWITRPNGSLKLLRDVLKALTLLSVVTFALEHSPAHWMEIEYDKLSLFHLAGLTGLWGIVSALSFRELTSTRLKIVALFVGLVLLAAGMTWQFPAWIHGPMADVPARAFSVWLNAIGEVMPIWDESPYSAARLVVLLGLGLLALLATLRHRREVAIQNSALPFILLGGLLFLSLGLLQRRWLSYAFLFLWVPLIPTINQWVSSAALPGLRKILLTATPWLILALGGLLDEWKANAAHEPLPNRNAPVTLHFALQEIAHWFAAHPEGRPPRVMAHLDYGPELMYYHPTIEVVATGYHRNGKGILDSYDFFHTTHSQEAAAIAERREITHVLISRYRFEKEYFQVELPQRSLHTLLLKKQPPAWLEKIELPAELESEFTLYRVKTVRFFQ